MTRCAPCTPTATQAPLAKVHTLVAVVPVSEVDHIVRSGHTVTLDEYRRMTG